MADSDEEFDRRSRSRDKFKRERESERDERREEPHYERNRPREEHHHGRSGRDYNDRSRHHDNRHGGRERSPAYKKPRREDEGGMPPAPFYPPGYPPYAMPGMPAPGPWPMDPHMNMHSSRRDNNHNNDKHDNNEDSYMKRFKQFVIQLKDEIEADEAVGKYKKYQTDFKKTSITKFFKAHQAEEWLREKYHPDYVERKRKELAQCKVKRLEIYNKIVALGYLEEVGVCHADQDKLMKALDAAVIMMEGGTEHDLTILDGRDPNSDKPLVAIPVAKMKKQQKEPAEDKPDAEVEVKKEVTSQEEDSGNEDMEGEVTEEKEDKEEDAVTIKKEAPASPEEEGAVEEEESSAPATLPQPLHKPQSLFVRSLTPLITREDLLQVVKAQSLPGFLRLAMAEPLPDRKYYRRAWVTFAHNTDIKEACSVLMNCKVEKYDHELNVVINRELSKRVRYVPSLTRSLVVLQNDVKWLEDVVTELDTRARLWNVSSDDAEYEYRNPMVEEMRGFANKNLKVPELSEEMLDSGETDEDEVHSINNDMRLRAIDRLIIYLRIVHMVDYYNGTEFPNEDEMPNKIGVFHIRGPTDTSLTKTTLQEVSDWNDSLRKKINDILDEARGVSVESDEAESIGLKNETQAIEDFVKANTDEQGPGKFHCPLSGKKFKGPEFVRKHIFNKHAEKVDAVKKDVVFWNAYVMDPKRQMNPLYPPPSVNAAPTNGSYPAPYPGAGPVPPAYGHQAPRPGYPYPYPGYQAPFPAAPAPKGRKVISYNDLDAPDEYDILGV